MKKYLKLLGATVPVLGLAASMSSAQASTLQPNGINLGGSSFMDGFGKQDAGLAYIGLLQYRDSDRIYDARGNDNPAFVRPRLRSTVLLNQLAYTSEQRLFGGRLGATALLPVVRLAASSAPGSYVSLDSADSARMGDLTLGMFLQMDPVIEQGRPVFSQRFEIDVIAPSGDYDARHSANIGANSWAFNPYWAMTFLPSPRLEFSTRLHYLYNGRNDDPALGPAIREVKAGQAVWANFTASYQVLPQLRVGLNGYWFRQITDDKLNGQRDPVGAIAARGVRSTDLSLGPGALWTVDRNNLVFVNVYQPVRLRNASGGFHMNLRWIHDF